MDQVRAARQRCVRHQEPQVVHWWYQWRRKHRLVQEELHRRLWRLLLSHLDQERHLRGSAPCLEPIAERCLRSPARSGPLCLQVRCLLGNLWRKGMHWCIALCSIPSTKFLAYSCSRDVSKRFKVDYCLRGYVDFFDSFVNSFLYIFKLL